MGTIALALSEEWVDTKWTEFECTHTREDTIITPITSDAYVTAEIGDFTVTDSEKWSVRPDTAPENMEWGIQVALDGVTYGMSPSGVTTLDFEISGVCLSNECDVLFGFGSEEHYVALGLALDS